MALDRLTQITSVGITSGITLQNINVIGVVTATTLSASEGLTVTGIVTASSFVGNVTSDINPSSLNVTGVSTFQNDVRLGDNDNLYIGDGNDLRIFHNGSNSFIQDNGTGNLFIDSSNTYYRATSHLIQNSSSSENLAIFTSNGSVELYFDNAKEFETTGYGATVFGVLQSQGFQSSGIITAINGVQVGSASSITVGQSFIRNNQVGLGATDTTGRNAGIGTAAGTIIYNSTTGLLEYYTGANWNQLRNNFTATGGTITYSSGKTIHTFTSSGTFTVSSGSTLVDYLVIAGGGGGGGGTGGGGGAGGFRTGTGLPVSASPGSYTVTVGGGGVGGNSPSVPGGSTSGTNGNPSIFSTITSTGGGGGGNRDSSEAGKNGGSGGGGGGSETVNTAGSGNTPPTSPPQGNPGGSGRGGGADSAGGGGGGANATGTPSPSVTVGGSGGNGMASSISGSSVTYAGGGGGGGHSPASSSGGAGGGGAGGTPTAAGVAPGGAGTTNTGGGAGGNGGGTQSLGASGGSGIVIIAYPS